MVPLDNCGRKATELLCNGRLKVHDGLSHEMATTHPERINADIIAFIEER
ncbi:Non-heme chloroperoxidase [Sphingobium sp. C100]|nr:hypothetical protein [Sphingobium sp. C100]ETI61196.1 Non-heme chloroperoxidase [Sphingobium sp. C100]